MNRTLRFVLLSYTKVGESSRVLHTLSEDFGRRGFITGLPKGSGMAMFLPMNILEGVVVENRKSDLWRLKDIVSCAPLASVRSDVRKNSMTLFMSEVLFRTVREGACEEGLASWCERSLLTLDALEDDFSNFHLVWLLELCGALGFSPAAENLAPFAGMELKQFSSIIGRPLSEALMVPLKGEQRSRMASGILDYLSSHSEMPLNIKSLKVLSELYR